ncbi:hypothetical protein B0I33_101649 [Prauserella shujinwangii]|uniref:Uncharacterized protein n=1 Tax=Prauserella shujinwangii TaxID=1453103 RepID=A0A2T0M412_9PSEU|nr:hypothetical protein [Prauserella shujinwangii]PRX51495.1 hypothetical protein B0I33_101649 [Prauserella shujinwangii]
MESHEAFLARLDEAVRRAHDAIARMHADAVAGIRRSAGTADRHRAGDDRRAGDGRTAAG